STLGGTNGSPPAIVLNCFTAQECASGVRVVSMSSVTLCRVNGAGKVGTGCVGEAFSPGTVLAGKGVSTMGKSDFPVTRLRTNRYPDFDGCATASMSFPLRTTVTSAGAV